MTARDATRCPVCGVGTLADIAYDAGEHVGPEPEQQPESQQIDIYTCGHRVRGAPIEAADDRLDVERRRSEDTATPPPDAV
jgi:hypothetical protein